MNNKKRLIRKHEVMHLTGIEASSTLYYLINKRAFPSPVKLSERSVAWREEEVLAWIDSRKQAILK